MKLFSKRHSNSRLAQLEDRRPVNSRYYARRSELISSEARNRLVTEIKFLTSNDDFMEKFILYEDTIENILCFDENKLNNFSLAELGYRLTTFFNFVVFSMKSTKFKSSYSDDVEEYYDDSKLFDMAEIAILFARPEKRADIIRRFNTIFSEENSDYQIIEHLITKKSGETLKSLKNIIKDDNLRNKLSSYFDFEANNDYINAAKLSADIVNLIFSGVIKDQKPKEIKQLKAKLIKKLLSNKTDAEKTSRLDKYIDNLLLTSKNLSNDIYDVRHTEKSTLEILNDNIYKLISTHNMSIVELVLTTLKDDYVLSDDWEVIKQEYIKKYKINTSERLTITKVDSSEDVIDLNDIPF